MNIYLIWAAIIIIFGILEAITAGLVSIWFVFGAIGALIAALFGATIPVQVIIFIAVTIVTLIATRPLVKKYINPIMQRTNADRCIGEEAVVVEKIDNLAASGQVKINGNIWSARSADGKTIDVGGVVVAEKIEGVKLIVHQK